MITSSPVIQLGMATPKFGALLPSETQKVVSAHPATALDVFTKTACPLKFQGHAANYLLLLQLQERAEKEKQQNALKVQYPAQTLPFQPRVVQNNVRFGGIDPITTWALTTVADAVALPFFKKNPEQYKKVEKYSACPQSLADGHTHLITAKSSSSPKWYYEEAEKKFIEASNATEVGTTKSHALRRAAIAAKLKGDDGAAKGYLAQARAARWKAEGSSSGWIEPKGDIDKCEKECRDTSTKVTTALKNFLLPPVVLIPAVFVNAVTNYGGDVPLPEFKRKTLAFFSPHNAAIDNAQETLKAKYKELEGEASDDEWINSENDPRGKKKSTSTGKGLRHTYI